MTNTFKYYFIKPIFNSIDKSYIYIKYYPYSWKNAKLILNSIVVDISDKNKITLFSKSYYFIDYNLHILIYIYVCVCLFLQVQHLISQINDTYHMPFVVLFTSQILRTIHNYRIQFRITYIIIICISICCCQQLF